MADPTQDASAVGRHNADLAASTARIIEGGTWKRQRVVTVVPSGPTVPAKVALSWFGLIHPPNQPAFRMLALGLEVGEAYQRAIDEILAHPELSQWEYVLTLEHDNTPQPDGLIGLIRRMESRPDLHCIGGLYWTKGPGGVPQIWGDVKDPILNFRPQAPAPMGAPWEQQLVECCGTGMGFNLWRLSMFRELAKRESEFPRPWFKTLCSTTEGVGTQDLYFWQRARPLGYRCAIDCSVLVGHHDHASGITW